MQLLFENFFRQQELSRKELKDIKGGNGWIVSCTTNADCSIIGHNSNCYRSVCVDYWNNGSYAISNSMGHFCGLSFENAEDLKAQGGDGRIVIETYAEWCIYGGH